MPLQPLFYPCKIVPLLLAHSPPEKRNFLGNFPKAAAEVGGGKERRERREDRREGHQDRRRKNYFLLTIKCNQYIGQSECSELQIRNDLIFFQQLLHTCSDISSQRRTF